MIQGQPDQGEAGVELAIGCLQVFCTLNPRVAETLVESQKFFMEPVLPRLEEATGAALTSH